MIQNTNTFTFGGIHSADYGVWISGTGTFNSPERDVEKVIIPGRNGALTRDNGRFDNMELKYPAFISREFQPRFDDFRAALLSKRGYQRLEDTYHPNEFRLAMFTGPLEPKTGIWNRTGKFDIEFDCKPQRFLKVGEQAVTLEADGALFNPTGFDALPLIRAYGTGTLTVNGYTVTVNYANGYTDIDCDLQDAYRGVENCNGYIELTDYEYPKLSPGSNAVSFTGFSRVEITPRWWTI